MSIQAEGIHQSHAEPTNSSESFADAPLMQNRPNCIPELYPKWRDRSIWTASPSTGSRRRGVDAETERGSRRNRTEMGPRWKRISSVTRRSNLIPLLTPRGHRRLAGDVRFAQEEVRRREDYAEDPGLDRSLLHYENCSRLPLQLMGLYYIPRQSLMTTQSHTHDTPFSLGLTPSMMPPVILVDPRS